MVCHPLDLRDRPQNGVECADAERIMVGNRQPMMPRTVSFKNHVAALLIDPAIAVMFAE